MNKKKLVVAIACVLCASLSQQVYAAEYNWTGDGSSNNLGDSLNWAENTLPSGSLNDLIFDATAITNPFPVNTVNSLGALTGTTYKYLSFSSGDFSVTGSPLELWTSDTAETNSGSINPTLFVTDSNTVINNDLRLEAYQQPADTYNSGSIIVENGFLELAGDTTAVVDLMNISLRTTASGESSILEISGNFNHTDYLGYTPPSTAYPGHDGSRLAISGSGYTIYNPDGSINSAGSDNQLYVSGSLVADDIYVEGLSVFEVTGSIQTGQIESSGYQSTPMVLKEGGRLIDSTTSGTGIISDMHLTLDNSVSVNNDRVADSFTIGTGYNGTRLNLIGNATQAVSERIGTLFVGYDHQMASSDSSYRYNYDYASAHAVIDISQDSFAAPVSLTIGDVRYDDVMLPGIDNSYIWNVRLNTDGTFG